MGTRRPVPLQSLLLLTFLVWIISTRKFAKICVHDLANAVAPLRHSPEAAFTTRVHA
jgi:hypothetical protein